MPDRYYSAEPIEGATATLSGSEAHHLLHVMRAQPGLEIVLFDGRGGEYEATVTRCDRSTVEVHVRNHRDVERELPYDLTLAVALPKSERQRWLVEKSVELGVTKFVPLRTEYSVSDSSPAKLSRYIVEASKQCGRNRLMDIAPMTAWDEFCGDSATATCLIAHPGGRPLAEVDHDPASDLCVAVGPEGGFTEEEIAKAVDVGWSKVDLGSRILRIETAAVALVSAVTIA